jgi:hypothetical protein
MIIEKDLKKLFSQLIHSDSAQLCLSGSDVSIRFIDKATKLSFATPVYFGGNFIPKSVRKCISQKAPFDQGDVRTFLTVDENSFQIHLNYLGSVEYLNHQLFVDLLEEFSWQAEEWRIFLDEHDKNDLVHVRVK